MGLLSQLAAGASVKLLRADSMGPEKSFLRTPSLGGMTERLSAGWEEGVLSCFWGCSAFDTGDKVEFPSKEPFDKFACSLFCGESCGCCSI